MEVYQLNKDEVMTAINKLNANVKKVDESQVEKINEIIRKYS